MQKDTVLAVMSIPIWTPITIGLIVLAGANHHRPAATATAPKAKGVMHDSTGADVGTVEARRDGGGVRIILKVHGVPPGNHGVHVHANSACSSPGTPGFAAAGPHFDPTHANAHDGLNGTGHAGDLGNISVGADGKGKLDVVASKLNLEADSAGIMGKAVVLHANADNLTDSPANGGAGGRLACGVLARK